MIFQCAVNTSLLFLKVTPIKLFIYEEFEFLSNSKVTIQMRATDVFFYVVLFAFDFIAK